MTLKPRAFDRQFRWLDAKKAQARPAAVAVKLEPGHVVEAARGAVIGRHATCVRRRDHLSEGGEGRRA